MDTFLNWLKHALSDDTGNPSTLRLLCVFSVVVPILAWLGFCFYKGTWQPLDGNMVALILGAIAVLGGRKVLETSATANPSTPPGQDGEA